MTKPPWYGGNKIPDSYLKRFMTDKPDNSLPYDLRLFLSSMDQERTRRSA